MTRSETNTKDHRPLILGLGLMGLGSWSILRFVWNPGLAEMLRWASYLPMRCPLKLISGLDCPLCGLGRSLISVISGNWKGTWDFHPLGPLLIILCSLILIAYMLSPRAIQIVYSAFSDLRRGLNPRLKKAALTIILVALIAQTLALNSDYLSTISPW